MCSTVLGGGKDKKNDSVESWKVMGWDKRAGFSSAVAQRGEK